MEDSIAHRWRDAAIEAALEFNAQLRETAGFREGMAAFLKKSGGGMVESNVRFLLKQNRLLRIPSRGSPPRQAHLQLVR